MALTRIKTGGLTDSAVTSAKINADAVTNAKIADDAIDSEHYANTSIDAGHLASGVAASAIGDLSDAVTTATSNVGLGSTALDSITASSGNYNVALGVNAGTALTTGGSNVLVGYKAGEALVDDGSNVFIGKEAGSKATGGLSIAIGDDAMRVHTTGEQNVVIGHSAMSNTDDHASTLSAEKNVFIGSYSGSGDWNEGGNSTDGPHKNVGVGTLTMSGALQGSIQNTCVGYNAGSSITTGSNNTCIGMSGGPLTTTGSNNTMIGTAAGENITTGSNNIALGYDTGNITGTHSNCISIGTSARASSNEVSIGKSGNLITSQFTGTPNWAYSSDERKKRNIQDVGLGLDFINDLRTVTFQWKPAEEHPEEWGNFIYEKDEDGNDVGEKVYSDMDTDIVMHGMVAQEVKAAMDSVGSSAEHFKGWREDANGEQSLAPSAFVYPLIKAVQELSAKVEALEAK